MNKGFVLCVIVILFQIVLADVKPLTLQDVDTPNGDIKPTSVGWEKLIRLPRTYKSGGGSYCNPCGGGGGGYPIRGGGGGGGGGAGSWSQSSSSSSSGSFGGGYPSGGGGGYCNTCG